MFPPILDSLLPCALSGFGATLPFTEYYGILICFVFLLSMWSRKCQLCDKPGPLEPPPYRKELIECAD